MLNRRDFLRATLFVGGALIAPGCTSEPERELTEGSAFFPQSVASGDPKPDSVILWTRVNDSDLASVDQELEFEVATDADFKTLVSLGDTQATVKALAKYDHCVKVKLTGLSPAT